MEIAEAIKRGSADQAGRLVEKLYARALQALQDLIGQTVEA
jgi:hypothetical protein